MLGSQEITDSDSNLGCVRPRRCFEKYDVKEFPECFKGQAPSVAIQGTREKKNTSTSMQCLHNIWNSGATPPIVEIPFLVFWVCVVWVFFPGRKDQVKRSWNINLSLF